MRDCVQKKWLRRSAKRVPVSHYSRGREGSEGGILKGGGGGEKEQSDTGEKGIKQRRNPGRGGDNQGMKRLKYREGREGEGSSLKENRAGN